MVTRTFVGIGNSIVGSICSYQFLRLDGHESHHLDEIGAKGAACGDDNCGFGGSEGGREDDDHQHRRRERHISRLDAIRLETHGKRHAEEITPMCRWKESRAEWTERR